VFEEDNGRDLLMNKELRGERERLKNGEGNYCDIHIVNVIVSLISGQLSHLNIVMLLMIGLEDCCARINPEASFHTCKKHVRRGTEQRLQ
jgi:hypothetical protein